MEGSGPEQRHFLRPFPPQRTEKLLAASASSRKEGMAFLDKAGFGGEILAPRPH